MSNRFRLSEIVAVVAVIAVLAAILLPAILAARETARRKSCENNLKQVSLAVLSYSDTYKTLPPGTCGSRELPPADRFSWYVPLWNFIEGKPPTLLIDETQAWNSEVNRFPQIERTIDWSEPTQRKEIRPLHELHLFGCPSAGRRESVLGISVTHYVGMGGLGKESPELNFGESGCGAWGYDRQLRSSDVVDGLSSTISIIETNLRPGPWLAGGPPTVRGVDIASRPYLGHDRQFGGLHTRGCQSVTLDASVRFLANETDPEVFAAMATIAGQD